MKTIKKKKYLRNQTKVQLAKTYCGRAGSPLQWHPGHQPWSLTPEVCYVPRVVEVVIHIAPAKEDLVTHTVLAFMFSKGPLNRDSQWLQSPRSVKCSLWKEEQVEQVGLPQMLSHIASPMVLPCNKSS